MRNQGHKWTLKTNDANQANTYLRSNYPEEVVTRRHRVRASQGCLARIVELDQRSQFKAEKPKLAKLSSREIPKEGPRPNQRAFEEQRTVNLRVRETSSLSLTVLLVLLTTLLGPLAQWTQSQEK